MWRLKFFICIVLFCLGVNKLYSQNIILVDSVDVKECISAAATDTVWFVNYQFNERPPMNQVKLHLVFKNYTDAINGKQAEKIEIEFQPIDYKDGSLTGTSETITGALSDTLKFDELGEGVYKMKMTFLDGSNNKIGEDGSNNKIGEVGSFLFNKKLDFEIIDVPGHVTMGNCLNGKPDTCIFTLQYHRYNPKGTKYEMSFSNSEDNDFAISKPGNAQDTFLVVFNGPVGDRDLFVGVKATYEYKLKGTKKTISEMKMRIDKLQKYERPDLAKMFNFRDTASGELEGCTENVVEGLKYDEEINKKYLDYKQDPQFKTKEYFNIQYYRKDSIKQKDWVVISGAEKDQYVVDSADFIFLKAGLYRIRVEAENWCGRDTLDTEIIRNAEGDSIDNRVIRIHRNDVKDLSIENNLLCRSAKGKADTIVIRDKAELLNWEDTPTYEITMSLVLKDVTGADSLAKIDETNQNKYYGDQIIKYYKNEKGGTDSAVIRIPFYEKGQYVLHLSKTTSMCSTVEEEFQIKIGGEPLLSNEEWWKDSEGMPMKLSRMCGLYEYKLPKDVEVDSNFYKIEAYEWQFGKGKYVEKYSEKLPLESFVFDSLSGEANYITLRAKNKCGWSDKDSIPFKIYAQPDVSVWRDSLPKADTLCMDTDYDYFFKGTLPDHFRIDCPEKNIVNCKDSVVRKINSGEYAGKFPETFTIVNTDYENCKQVIEDTVWVTSEPIFEVYDTIHFCSSVDVVKTWALVSVNLADINYKKLEWEAIKPIGESFIAGTELPDVIAKEKKKDFPDFEIKQDTSILRYKVSNGSGCFMEGQIVLIRHPEPKLELKIHEKETCEGIGVALSTDEFMKTSISEAQNLTIETDGVVYYPVETGKDLNPYVCPADKDSVTVIYKAWQKHNYTAQKGCDIIDSVKLHISHPVLHVLKRDTVFDPTLIYDFKQIKDFIDTNDVKNLTWKVVKGFSDKLMIPGDVNAIYDYKYDFNTTPDRTDSAHFELKGLSFCGEEFKDTLKVWNPKVELIVPELHLCDTQDEYTLWSNVPDDTKVYGYFVDTNRTTLKWSILSGDGSIAGEGVNAKYIFPAKKERASVTIQVSTKSLLDHSAIQKTFTLNIWKAPHFKIYNDKIQPFVLVQQDTLKINELGVFENAKEGVTWKLTRAGFGSFPKPDRYLPKYNGNGSYRDSIYFEAYALLDDQKGCPDVFRDTLKLIVYPQPKVMITPDTLKMCDGDVLTVGKGGNGSVTVWGSNISQEWTAASGCTTCLINSDENNHTVQFQPINPGYEKIYLSVHGAVNNYKGESRVLEAKDSVTIKIYKKPDFKVINGKDILCYQETQVNVSGVTINNPESYPLKYTVSGGLTGNYPDYILPLEAKDSAKIFITAELDGCHKWDDKKDSIVIIRLPKLEGTLQEEDSVCRNSTLELHAKAGQMKYTWSSLHGGTFSDVNILEPTYIPPVSDDILFDTVRLTLTPLVAKCPGEKILEQSIKLVTPPAFDLKKDTVCTNELDFTLEYEEAERVKSVTWSSDGDGSFIDEHAVMPVYTLGVQDKLNGKVKISADFVAKIPCNSVIHRELELTILKAPEIDIKPDANLVVCQGDSLDIDFITSSSGVDAYFWEVSNGTLNDDKDKAPRFYPGEYSGQVEVKVTLTGKKECVSAPQKFEVTVKPARKPGILADAVVCEGISMEFSTDASANSYSWDFGEMGQKSGNPVTSSFSKSGDQQIRLEVAYVNGCERVVYDTVKVYPKPEPKFKADSSIVGVGKDVHFVNQTEGSVESQWWYVDGVNKSENVDFVYQFEKSDVYDITLEIEDEHGCHNKSTQAIAAILKPQALFTVELENPEKPCDNSKAIFTNQTQGDEAYLTYEWILNTDRKTGVDTTAREPGGDIRYAASIYKDTVYDVTLVVRNAAGVDSLTQQIKIVSPLQPRLEVITHGNGCTPAIREIANLTLGTADWYRINWGDGSADSVFYKNTGRNLKHRYDNDSDKTIIDTIRMSAGNKCGEDSVKVPIKLYPNTAIAKIKVDESVGISGCYMFNAKFHNISTGFGGVKKALWDFGEGEPLIESDKNVIENLFENPGEYKVRLIVFDECNSNEDSVRIYVKGNHKLDFKIKQDIVCSNEQTILEVEPELKDQFYDYYWNLNYSESTKDDWHSYNETTIDHTWSPGEYTVALKATSLDGCEVYRPAFKTVKVYKKPVADFNLKADGIGDYQNCQQVLTGCQPLKVGFQRIGNSEGDITYWDFGGDGASSELTPIHTFGDMGPFTVKMKVTTSDGCVDSTQGVVSVLKSPEPSFDILSDKLLCTPDGNFSIRLHNTTNRIEENTYQWFYNQHQFSDSQEPSEHALRAQFGKIGIILRATNILSACSKEYSDTIVSSPVVVADFSIEPQKVCEGETVKFNSHSLPGDQVEWDLGDRSGLYTDTVIEYLYEKPGEYTVKIKLQNEYGCEAPAEKSVRVYPMPTADFTYEFDNQVIDEELSNIDFENPGNVPTGGVIFTNHSTVQAYDFVGENPLTYKWLVNDSEIVGKDLRYQFDNNGSYVVKLVAVGANQCRDTFADVVSIGAVKGLYIPNAFAPATGIDENPGTALFLPKGVGLYSYKIQIFDQWGRCVWSSEKLEAGKPAEAWDGTVEGEPLPKDVYLWKVNAVFIDGSVWTGEGGNTQGYVTLIR